MAKVSVSHKLVELMSASKDHVSKQDIATHLNVSLISVPVYIHNLKEKFKLEIVSVRSGREVIGYKLENKENINFSSFERGNKEKSVSKNKKKKEPKNSEEVEDKKEIGEVAVPDKDLEIVQVSEREFNDIRSSLGIDSFNSNNFGDF